MKQTFLLLIFTALFGQLYAQITINSNDVISIGYVANQSTDTLPDASIVEGGVGNINWDFTALKPGEDGQYVFFDPSTTPYAASFPSANLASRVETDLYAYIIKDSDKIEIIGVEGTINLLGFPIQGKLEVTPGQSIIRFPATYGDEYDETIVQQGQVSGAEIGIPSIDSARLVNTVVRSVDIDAWGTMEIPSGSFNTIRSSENETTTSQVYFYTNGAWVPQGPPTVETVVYYNWWTIDNDGLAFPVVQMVFDPSASNNPRTVTYLLSLTDVENLFQTSATLFPNPASDFLRIEFNEPLSGLVEVYNMSGQKVITQKFINSSTEVIGLHACGSGVHIAVLKNGDGKISGYYKFEIFK